jgi:hypothetical protein
MVPNMICQGSPPYDEVPKMLPWNSNECLTGDDEGSTTRDQNWYLESKGNKLMTTDAPLTITVPEAGKTYFDLSRNAAYAAAKRGEIPTIKIGKLLRVPVRTLEQKLDAVG